MAKNLTTIVDIGSQAIVTLIGERGVNNSFKILGKGDVSYDGFSNGKFFDPDNLKNVIALSVANAENTAGIKVTDVFIGVPGEFCTTYCEDVSLNFGRGKKIRQSHITELVKMGAKTHKAYTIINKSAVFYSLDNGKRVIDPIGKVSSQLSAKMCYCLAENNFLDYIDGILSDIGIKRATYISANLAEILYMLDPSLRDRYAILVDIGYITTSVMVAHGDGLLALYSFSLGGGHITGDLYEVLKIPFSQAEMLKHKIVLGWNATENDTYEVMGKEFISTYSAKATNEIAEARLEIIAEYINRCLDKCPYEFPDYLPVYITGGGVCYIKGAKDFLAKKLGRKVEFISPRLSQYDRPDYSSEIAMLDVAIEQTEYGYNLIY